MRKIILASASPRRKELLEQIGVAFEIYPAKGEEKVTNGPPHEVVRQLALQKAHEVAGVFQEQLRVEARAESHEILVIGADTLVACQGKILGKPKDHGEAVEMLAMLSGNTHSVYTGVALLKLRADSLKVHDFHEETRVTMYPMSQREIEAYVATGEPMDKADSHIWDASKRHCCWEGKADSHIWDASKRHYCWEGKAGGYGIQDPFGIRYIKGIQGDYYNVMGLPVSRVCRELKEMGIQI